jgi:hypothetical protein
MAESRQIGPAIQTHTLEEAIQVLCPDLVEDLAPDIESIFKVN